MKNLLSFLILLLAIVLFACQQTKEVIPPKSPVKIGDKFAGGVVFFVEADGQHGLMTYENDISDPTTGATFLEAFTQCDNFQTSVGGDPKLYTDWYLPTAQEMKLLYDQKATVGQFKNDYYWTSTEDLTNASLAYAALFANGSGGGDAFLADRKQKFHVRPVRKF